MNRIRLSKARLLAGAAALALAALALPGCGPKAEEEAAADPVIAVRTGRVSPRDFPDEILVPGRWRSGGESLVTAPFAAFLESVSVRPGDAVEAGQLVAWLVTRESRAALAGAERLLQVARDEAERNEAERALSLARLGLVRVPMKAPRRGVVLRRSAEPGAILAESAEILALTAPEDIVFEAHVPAAVSSRLRRGLEAEVSSPGALAVRAALDRILPTTGEGDQSALAWLKPRALRTPAPGLDLFGEARILLGPAHRSLAVPDSAIVEDDVTGEKKVAVVVGGRALWQAIHAGIRSGGWCELRDSSLPLNAVVVVEGQHGMPDSSRVKIQP